MTNKKENSLFYKFLTYNVYFADFFFNERMQLILDIINMHKPDIICLQEIKTESLNYFKENLLEYNLFPNTLDHHHGQIICSREIFSDAKIIKLPTKLGRQLILAETFLGDLNVAVGNIHLESIFNQIGIKLEQFKSSFKNLNRFDHSVLMGDTNILITEERYFEPPPKWIDIWEELERPQNAEFSYDGTSNSLAEEEFKSRIDRIYLKSGKIYPVSLKFVGTRSYNEIYPSNHFGLLTQVSLE